jgi:hypothetical protein
MMVIRPIRADDYPALYSMRLSRGMVLPRYR